MLADCVAPFQVEFDGEFCGDIGYESNHYANALNFASELSATNSTDHQQMLLENMSRCFHLAGDQTLERRARAQILAMSAMEEAEVSVKASAAYECLVTGLDSALQLLLGTFNTGMNEDSRQNDLMEQLVERRKFAKTFVHAQHMGQFSREWHRDSDPAGWAYGEQQTGCWVGMKRTECIHKVQMIYFELCRVWRNRNLSHHSCYTATDYVTDLQLCVELPTWWSNEDAQQTSEGLQDLSRDEFGQEPVELDPVMVRKFCTLWDTKRQTVHALTDLPIRAFVLLLESVSASTSLGALWCSCSWAKARCDDWYQSEWDEIHCQWQTDVAEQCMLSLGCKCSEELARCLSDILIMVCHRLGIDAWSICSSQVSSVRDRGTLDIEVSCTNLQQSMEEYFPFSLVEPALDYTNCAYPRMAQYFSGCTIERLLAARGIKLEDTGPGLLSAYIEYFCGGVLKFALNAAELANAISADQISKDDASKVTTPSSIGPIQLKDVAYALEHMTECPYLEILSAVGHDPVNGVLIDEEMLYTGPDCCTQQRQAHKILEQFKRIWNQQMQFAAGTEVYVQGVPICKLGANDVVDLGISGIVQWSLRSGYVSCSFEGSGKIIEINEMHLAKSSLTMPTGWDIGKVVYCIESGLCGVVNGPCIITPYRGCGSAELGECLRRSRSDGCSSALCFDSSLQSATVQRISGGFAEGDVVFCIRGEPAVVCRGVVSHLQGHTIKSTKKYCIPCQFDAESQVDWVRHSDLVLPLWQERVSCKFEGARGTTNILTSKLTTTPSHQHEFAAQVLADFEAHGAVLVTLAEELHNLRIHQPDKNAPAVLVRDNRHKVDHMWNQVQQTLKPLGDRKDAVLKLAEAHGGLGVKGWPHEKIECMQTINERHTVLEGLMDTMRR